MIDPKAVTTYAQYNEDLILLTLFHEVEKGFYIDIGASYPTIDSVTRLFYDKGWSGINIEPIKGLHKQLQEERPRDVNLQCGIGEKSGQAVLREYKTASGHSTFDTEQKKRTGTSLDYIDYEVPIKSLKEIFIDYKVQHINFLKIDVEGFEYQVIAGNDWNEFRPESICIEANHVSKDWRPILAQHGYKLFIADGLNEYYVAEESWHRTKDFAERIIKLDYHALKQHQMQSWSEDTKELVRLHKIVAEQHAIMQAQTGDIKNLQELATLSLKNQPWAKRVLRSTHGLTIDWVRYRKSDKNSK